MSLSGERTLAQATLLCGDARMTSAQPEPVQFSGLPEGITGGLVLGHGPYQPGNPPRPFSVENGVFTDLAPYAPHNARVYRFELPAS